MRQWDITASKQNEKTIVNVFTCIGFDDDNSSR